MPGTAIHFAASPGGNGSQVSPYNSLAVGLPWVASGGTARLQGTAPMPVSISQILRIETGGGVVRLGAP